MKGDAPCQKGVVYLEGGREEGDEEVPDPHSKKVKGWRRGSEGKGQIFNRSGGPLRAQRIPLGGGEVAAQ